LGDIGHIEGHGQRPEPQTIGAREPKIGRILHTLSNVRDLVLRLGDSTVSAQWRIYAGELSLKAAKSGKRSDIKLTEQLYRVLEIQAVL
jgi:hypothetical protein